MSDESALHGRTEPGPLLAAYLRARYALKRALSDLSPADRDEYHRLLDAYNVTRNGDARFVAIAAVLNREVQGAQTLLDLGCYEGYAIAHLMRHTALRSFAGVEVSPRLITRAQDTCRGLTGSFHLFNLERLYADPQLRSESWMTRYDVVLAAEMLYYLGPRSYPLRARSGAQARVRGWLARLRAASRGVPTLRQAREARHRRDRRELRRPPGRLGLGNLSAEALSGQAIENPVHVGRIHLEVRADPDLFLPRTPIGS